MSEFWPQFQEILVSGLIVFGSLLVFIAAIGVLRFADVIKRMHAASIAGPVGGAFIMVGLALFTLEPVVITKSLAVVVFIFATSPVAGHAIARAAYVADVVKLAERRIRDDLKGHYDHETGALSGAFPPDSLDSDVAPTANGTPGIDSLEADVQGLKNDVQGLQEDVVSLKKGLATLQDQKEPPPEAADVPTGEEQEQESPKNQPVIPD